MASKYAKQLNKYNAILEKKPNDPYTLSILSYCTSITKLFE